MTELSTDLRALSPGYYKMDGSYVEIGREAADEIERLNLELRNERDVRAEAERGCVSMAKEIKRLVAENKELRARAADKCDHRWVDARNEHVLSGEVCPKCGAIRAGNRGA